MYIPTRRRQLGAFITLISSREGEAREALSLYSSREKETRLRVRGAAVDVTVPSGQLVLAGLYPCLLSSVEKEKKTHRKSKPAELTTRAADHATRSDIDAKRER